MVLKKTGLYFTRIARTSQCACTGKKYFRSERHFGQLIYDGIYNEKGESVCCLRIDTVQYEYARICPMWKGHFRICLPLVKDASLHLLIFDRD